MLAPCALSHGPLTVYAVALDGCPDLAPLVCRLPETSPLIWLDSARPHPVTGRWSLLGFDPWLTFTARGDRMELTTSASTQVWRAHPLEALRQILRRYQAPGSGQPHARATGLMGYLSYELNRWIERLPAPVTSDHPLPEMGWFAMRAVILLDHGTQRSWIFSIVDPHSPGPVARRQAQDAFDRVHQLIRESTVTDDLTPLSLSQAPSLSATSTQSQFEDMVRRALEYIRAGDIFQANLSQRFTAPWHQPVVPLYLRLRRINPSPFACLVRGDEASVVSCSPERLVRVQDRRIDTRPIAGTRPRGQTPADDAMQSLELLLSEKERAEHIMLVDLERNDLGRVCTPGSVGVDELMALEAYSHVIHIVSNVSGRLRRGTDAVDVIRAVFPGGTITGCPKVRCMEIVRELEPVARELYSGSLGELGFDGTLDLNIAIRTMVIRRHRLSFHVGAGIVADSDPEREYHETLAKAAALMRALSPAGDASVSRDAARG